MKELLSVEVAVIIAHNLRRIRKRAGVTQQEVADLAGINRVDYAKFETAKRLATIPTLLKIAVALNVTMDELLKGVLEAAMKEED